MSPHTRRRGTVSVAVLLLLAVMCSLAIAYVALANHNVLLSNNQRHVTCARLNAEGGLSFMLQQLQTALLHPNTTPATFLTRLCETLNRRLADTANLAGASAQVVGSTVVVPEIATGDGGFQCTFELLSADRARLKVRGRDGAVYRTVAVEFNVRRVRSAAFDYGLASKGQISVAGNAEVIAANDPNEASVLSTSSQADAIQVGGSARVDGDLSVSADGAGVSISGSPTVAGSSDPAVIDQHIHTGVEEPMFPTVDVLPFMSLPTQVVDSGTDLSGQDLVLNNIRIAAGTNPTFNHDVVLNGIVYVESPNIVRFEGKARVNGILVTDDTDLPLSSCQIFFAGSVEARGVEALPDTPAFHDIKQLTGTFILAPGFGVTFAGNVSASNGTIAADQLTFTGTAEGLVQGSVIGLEDLPTSVSGNVEIRLDRSHANPDPVGFNEPFCLVPELDSYSEPAGQ